MISTYPPWLKVPDTIRKVFQVFPLYEHPPSPVPPSNHSNLEIYVYDCNQTCNDPECLQIQTLLRFHPELRSVKLCSGSMHMAKDGHLPLMIDKTGKKPVVYQQGPEIIARLYEKCTKQLNSDVKLQQSMICNSLGDAWILTILLTDRHTRTAVYLSESDFQLPQLVIARFLDTELTRHLIERLEPRYPIIAKAYSHLTLPSSFKSYIAELSSDILAKAEDCLNLYDAVLVDNEYIGGTSLCHLDIMLFSYVYLVNELLADTEFGKLVVSRPGIMHHSKLVYSVLYNEIM